MSGLRPGALTPRDRKCRHFTGVRDTVCAVGLEYRAVGSTDTQGLVLPCLGDKGGCGDYSPYTAAELAEQEAQLKLTMDRYAQGLSGCCGAALDRSKVIPSGRHKGHGPQYCSACKKLVVYV